MPPEKGDVLIGGAKGGVVLTRRAALLSPHLANIANNGRLGLDERIQAATSAEMMKVALDQPGRRRFGGLSDSLALFCRNMRYEIYAAGEQYDREVRAEKAARGFYVVDQVPDAREDKLTPEQIDAKNQLAIRRLEETNAVLRKIKNRLPWRMELLCYDRRPWEARDALILKEGLRVLMRHYSLLDEGINKGRSS